MKWFTIVTTLIALTFVTGCTGSDYLIAEVDGDLSTSDGDVEQMGGEETQTVSENFKVRESVEQLHIWQAEPETDFEVLNAEKVVLFSGATDYQGSLVIRNLPPGTDYLVRVVENPTEFTDQLTVRSVEDSYPDPSFYTDQVLEPGYGYITMRDGTTLSVFVSLPGPPEDGPYPTLVNYSGYSPSSPGESLGGVAEAFCGEFPVLCDAPNHPFGIIGGVMGYATVGVNIRGTGCSGGAYDYFETLQLLDGYDTVEIIANQDWVKNNQVGLVGLSYPGITQLFVASTRPPGLAAIAPFSVIADTYSSTLLPGGIYNTGFALEWIENVMNKAEPYAHNWITELVESGDAICEENQLLHSQLVDAIAKALDNPYYSDELAKPIDPTSFADQIDVPVFLVGQCQDEQTGPHFPALFDKFTASPLTRFTMTNGVHIDGFATQVLGEWFNFVSFYVDQEIPDLPQSALSLVPIFMEQVFDAPNLDFPPLRFSEYSDFAEAKADFEQEDNIRVIFESGAAPDLVAGAPKGTFETTFTEWPSADTDPLRFYFQPDGILSENLPPTDGGASTFEQDPEAGDRVTLNSGSVNVLQPDYLYRQLVPGKAISFITEPLSETLVMAGPGSVDIWLKSTANDADLEVNLTEVRPDGKEVYVQSGWLRASHRMLMDESTDLRPVVSHYETDIQPLVANEWNAIRIELMPFAHIFRKDSRIRLSIDTPGDSRAWWRFKLLEHETIPTHTLSHHGEHASSVLLPVIPDLQPPEELPDCNSLRGQPCRDYEIYTNTEVD